MTATGCRNCGSSERLVAHHVTPLQEGGTHDPSNGITLCAACHAPEHTSYDFKLVRSDGSPTRRVLLESIDELEEYGGLTAEEATAARKGCGDTDAVQSTAHVPHRRLQASSEPV